MLHAQPCMRQSTAVVVLTCLTEFYCVALFMQVRVICQSPLCLCGSPQLILVLPFLFLFLFLQLGICPISGFEAAWNQRTSAIAVFWKL